MNTFAPWTTTSPMQDKKDTLQTAIIKQGVTNIGSGDGGNKGAFGDCTNLTNIEIPNSVTSIGNLAFSGCTGLTEINIPDSVTEIGDYAFASIGSGSTIYCQTQEVADLFVDGTNYDSSITTVVVDSSRF